MIVPSYKSIYLTTKDNAFTFTIEEGSGFFFVSVNDTSKVEFDHIDRRIIIRPLREGPVLIQVEDNEVPNSVIATAVVVVSDIARLELTTNSTLLE